MKDNQMKNERGITLIALVITIIILIILATVTITLVFGEGGLIKRAQEGKTLTEQARQDEQDELKGAEEYINGILAGTGTTGEKSEVEEAKESGTTFENTTTIIDKLGNHITVPGGFKVSDESGDTVEQGIVIEDVSASTDENVQGSQFVWIPVGKFTKDNGEESSEIILGRYTFANDAQGTPTLQQAAYTDEQPENYKEEKVISNYYNEYSGTHRDGIASNGLDGINATAYNLGEWIESVKTNGGYYIGRYEASYASGTEIENYKAATKVSTRFRTKEDGSMEYTQGTLWNYITQLEASKVAINTYKESNLVKSDLMNSYAWDTAIVYIQECGHTNYANKTGININNELTNTGTKQDEVCKINDMASNMAELSTEYSSNAHDGIAYHCSNRGGYYYSDTACTTRRYSGTSIYSDWGLGFRLCLYL